MGPVDRMGLRLKEPMAVVTGLGSLDRIGAAACAGGGARDRWRLSKVLADLDGDLREGLCGRSACLPLDAPPSSPRDWACLAIGLGAWENRDCGRSDGGALGVGT